MSTALTSVGDLLFGQTRGRVLSLLDGAPDETLFIRQIARQVELALLAGAGLIKRSAVGSHVFYQAGQEHPEFPVRQGTWRGKGLLQTSLVVSEGGCTLAPGWGTGDTHVPQTRYRNSQYGGFFVKCTFGDWTWRKDKKKPDADHAWLEWPMNAKGFQGPVAQGRLCG